MLTKVYARLDDISRIKIIPGNKCNHIIKLDKPTKVCFTFLGLKIKTKILEPGFYHKNYDYYNSNKYILNDNQTIKNGNEIYYKNVVTIQYNNYKDYEVFTLTDEELVKIDHIIKKNNLICIFE